MKITDENRNGTPYIRICEENCDYTYGYFTNSQWIDDDNLVITEIDRENNQKSYLVNLETRESRLLHDHKSSKVVYGKTLYYLYEKCLWALDIDTMEKKQICSFEKNVGMPHVTSDGKFMSIECSEPGKSYGGAYIVDLEKGEIIEEICKVFEPPFEACDHYMICPTDHTKVFFAHEGTTEYISNRLWLWEKDKGMRCIAKQYLDEDGNLGDCFGHECWAPDGKGIWFVKYPVSPQPPKGLSYVDMEGNQKIAIYGKYPYWHVSCSADGRYLCADTQIRKYTGPELPMVSEEDMKLVYDSDCCVVNLETGEEKAAIRVVTNSKHPGHPHPMLSPNSKWLAFHDFVEGDVTLGFVKLEEINV